MTINLDKMDTIIGTSTNDIHMLFIKSCVIKAQ